MSRNLFMNQDYYNELDLRHSEIERQLKDLRTYGSSNSDRISYIEFKRHEQNLTEELYSLEEQLLRSCVCDPSDVVVIGDIVAITIKVGDRESAEKHIKLVSNMNYSSKDIQEASYSSQFGEAVYLKRVGSLCSYNANNKTITFQIKRKVLTETLENDNLSR